MIWWTLLRRFWKEAAVALLLVAVAIAWHTQYTRGVRDGIASQRATDAQEQAKADAAHNKRIQEINDASQAAQLDLQKRLQDALAHPVTRTIRVRIPASCTSQGPTDAGVPPEANPGDGLLTVDDPDYGRLRAWLLQYAAGPASGGSGTATPVPDSR